MGTETSELGSRDKHHNITLRREIIFLLKKIHKMLLLVFLGLLMAYLKRHRLRSYFKTNNCFIII